MDYLYWTLIILSFLIAFAGLIFPILPGALFLVLGFVLYGLFYSFQPFTLFFIVVQAILLASLFVVDYFSNLYGVKRRGGSKAAIWGSTIGLLVGPFVIPVAGIIAGPFIGAFLAELVIGRKSPMDAFRVGIGSVLGFLGGTVVKIVIQLVMVGYFLYVAL
ncbi:DUF456 domain-containing protein [Fictibacillus fluitans]|uniref:DUF456 domain-containing protein n=1 Tax=Fictibacillus fluitans TaxID=3058422 RepID=A0ABT8HX97_9BACL|nr:DUF456 domain-containing protein [Fictibacillus sp. NE201]MDN4525400.1 DUF456 domain-containing protein [Fictibacillus sp. NE201]